MLRQVSIEKLAPTGEGIARDAEGVGFVDGGLPGETVEAAVDDVRRRFWRGRAVRVLSASPDRVFSDHAGCAGCDWAHFDAAAGRDAKQELFFETMQRIGKLPRRLFGEAPIAPSPPGYRLRTRLHVSGGGSAVRIGYFARRSHTIESALACEALAPATRAILRVLPEALLASPVSVSEIAIVENRTGSERAAALTIEPSSDPPSGDLERLAGDLSRWFRGVLLRTARGSVLEEFGDPRVTIEIGPREFHVPANAFFQSNRFLFSTLREDVRERARVGDRSTALDAYAGVGLFAAALLDAGARVVSVEESPVAVRASREARSRGREPDRWRIVTDSVAGFLRSSKERFDVTVVDPPRTGLGTRLAREIASRTARRLLYVSCEPATLARDLPAILAEGFEIRDARLYDFFAFTHRIEALVTLSRSAA